MSDTIPVDCGNGFIQMMEKELQVRDWTNMKLRKPVLHFLNRVRKKYWQFYDSHSDADVLLKYNAILIQSMMKRIVNESELPRGEPKPPAGGRGITTERREEQQ